MQIKKATKNDFAKIFNLYYRVSNKPGGLARLVDEINNNYVLNFMNKSHDAGIELVAYSEVNEIVGEIHAYRPDIYCFSHVLSELTIVVDPKFQGHGIGRLLLEKFIEIVIKELPKTQRIELIARESNTKAIAFYESIGFKQEGKMQNRIKNVDGSYESDIPMAWLKT